MIKIAQKQNHRSVSFVKIYTKIYYKYKQSNLTHI